MNRFCPPPRGLVFLISFLIVAACGEREAGHQPSPGKIELSDAFTGSFALVDMHGQSRQQTDFAGEPMLVYFGFTSCPDVCPNALGVLSATLNELGPKADKIQPVFIALDPERDTPEALRAYLSFDSRILGLTGSEEAIEAATAGFKVFAERKALPGSALGYTIDHSSLFYYVDKQGAPRFAFVDSLTPQQLAALIKPLI